jgi:hypothetical protein
MRTLVALLLFALPAVASAQDLTWRWQDHDVLSYRIQTYMQFQPGNVRLYAAQNLDARVEDVALGLEIDCKSVVLTRRTQELECRVRRAEMGLGTGTGDHENAAAIAAEYAGLLSVALIQVELTREGKIKTFDLEGIPKDTEREAARHEALRMLVSRAFGALEIELPKDGDSRGEPWSQGGLPMTMRLPVTSGTVGKAKIKHTVESTTEAGIVTIVTQGEGSGQSGYEMELQKAQLASARVVQTVWVGTSKFDEKRGHLISNEYRIQGTLTASGSVGGSDYYMTQVGLAEWVPDWEAEAAAKQAVIDAELAAKAVAEDAAREMAEDEARAIEAAEGKGAEEAVEPEGEATPAE